MPIRAVTPKTSTAIAAVVGRVRSRPSVTLAQPASPPPTMGSWVIDIEVVDATQMFERAVNVMKGANATTVEINERLTHGEGAEMVVDIDECMKVLFDFMYRSIENLTGCPVGEPKLYLEPLVVK